VDVREIRWHGMDMIYLAHDRNPWQTFVNTVMNFQFSYNVVKLLVS
jgi:hypothetical protein